MRPTLGAWVEGTSGPIASASIEQHLVQCAQCRAAVAGLVRIEDVPGSWDDVLAEVSGGAGLVERVLIRLGLRAGDAVVVGAAPVLRIAWSAGLAAVLGFILARVDCRGRPRPGAVSRWLAPLMPVAGVAAAYGPSVDPSYELGLAAPYRMIRLVLLRSGGRAACGRADHRRRRAPAAARRRHRRRVGVAGARVHGRRARGGSVGRPVGRCRCRRCRVGHRRRGERTPRRRPRRPGAVRRRRLRRPHRRRSARHRARHARLAARRAMGTHPTGEGRT